MLSPGLSIEEQWVCFEGHGAVCGGRGFGQDQTDQRVQATVARARIITAQQLSSEAQHAGKEELRESEEEKMKCHGVVEKD